MSEFRRFIETLRALGVAFEIDYSVTKERWQKNILDAGFNTTALSTTVVRVGSSEFLFANAQAIWEVDEGFGPAGAFLLSRDSSTGRVANRVAFDVGTGDLVPGSVGVAALRRAHNF